MSRVVEGFVLTTNRMHMAGDVRSTDAGLLVGVDPGSAILCLNRETAEDIKAKMEDLGERVTMVAATLTIGEDEILEAKALEEA